MPDLLLHEAGNRHFNHTQMLAAKHLVCDRCAAQAVEVILLQSQKHSLNSARPYFCAEETEKTRMTSSIPQCVISTAELNYSSQRTQRTELDIKMQKFGRFWV